MGIALLASDHLVRLQAALGSNYGEADFGCLAHSLREAVGICATA